MNHQEKKHPRLADRAKHQKSERKIDIKSRSDDFNPNVCIRKSLAIANNKLQANAQKLRYSLFSQKTLRTIEFDCVHSSFMYGVIFAFFPIFHGFIEIQQNLNTRDSSSDYPCFNSLAHDHDNRNANQCNSSNSRQYMWLTITIILILMLTKFHFQSHSKRSAQSELSIFSLKLE